MGRTINESQNSKDDFDAPTIILPHKSDIYSEKKCINDILDKDLQGKKVLVRCDLNVPIDDSHITDDTRIRLSIPTIKYLIEKNAFVTICSHFGRPKKGPDPKYSLQPVAERMSHLLGQKVTFLNDCIGEAVHQEIMNSKEGSVIMLQNTRFYKEETKNDDKFGAELAKPFDLFVNDAFGSAHRAHASTESVARMMAPNAVSGFLLARELSFLSGAMMSGKRPMAAIVGGSKVSSKLTVLQSLLDKCDVVIIGGGMAFTFLKAMGLEVGSSLVEDDFLDMAREIMARAKRLQKKLILPSDIVIADEFSNNAKRKIVSARSIPRGWMGLDNGPETTTEQSKALLSCKTVIMNGPMGVFEFKNFNQGTFKLIEIIANLTRENTDVTTIIGGGDSVAACEQSGYAGYMSHISTGGGASLELLEGKILPGIAVLSEK